MSILSEETGLSQMHSARLLLDQIGQYVACTMIDPRRALETARQEKQKARGRV
jgi:hypothetical protein